MGHNIWINCHPRQNFPKIKSTTFLSQHSNLIDCPQYLFVTTPLFQRAVPERSILRAP